MDLSQFSVNDLRRLSESITKVCESARSAEECAALITRHLYEQFVEPETGQPSCALVRFFKTQRVSELPPSLKKIALSNDEVDGKTNALVLLGTAGLEAAWNARTLSTAHQVIPLLSTQMVARSPMIAQLLKQLGIDAMAVVRPNPDLLMDMHEDTYNVFYVEEAKGSPFIPAQNAFVLPYGVRSIIGFGGILNTGDFYAVILFARVLVSRKRAELFKPLAITIKNAMLQLDSQPVFSETFSAS